MITPLAPEFVNDRSPEEKMGTEEQEPEEPLNLDVALDANPGEVMGTILNTKLPIYV